MAGDPSYETMRFRVGSLSIECAVWTLLSECRPRRDSDPVTAAEEHLCS